MAAACDGEDGVGGKHGAADLRDAGGGLRHFVKALTNENHRRGVFRGFLVLLSFPLHLRRLGDPPLLGCMPGSAFSLRVAGGAGK